MGYVHGIQIVLRYGLDYLGIAGGQLRHRDADTLAEAVAGVAVFQNFLHIHLQELLNMILPHFTRFDRKGQTKTEENAQKPFCFACNRAVEYRIDRRSSAPAVFLL